MHSKKNIVLGVITFLICLILGYGGIKMLKPQKDEITLPLSTPPDVVESIQYITTRIDTICRDDTTFQVITKEKHYADLINGDTIPRSNEFLPQEEEIISFPPPPVKPDRGRGSVDPPVHKTSYLEPPTMTKEEFQRLLLDPSDNILIGVGNNQVSGHVRISVSGMHSDEAIRPTKVQDVREKLSTETWKDVRVNSVHFNSKGIIDAATVTPIY